MLLFLKTKLNKKTRKLYMCLEFVATIQSISQFHFKNVEIHIFLIFIYKQEDIF